MDHKRTFSSSTELPSILVGTDHIVNDTEHAKESSHLNRKIPVLSQMYESKLMVAIPSEISSVCWISSFPVSPYEIVWNDKSIISTLISKEEIEDYCKKASKSIEEPIYKVNHIQALKFKRIMKIGVFLVMIIVLFVLAVGVYVTLYWVAVLVFVFVVFSLFCLYNEMRKRLHTIRKEIKKFIKKQNLAQNFIQVKVEKYGKFLSFYQREVVEN